MKQLTVFISVLLVFGACTERIDINLNTGENNRLVVEGGITNQSKVHTIKLTRSADYFSQSEAPPELGATVTISDDEQTLTLTDADNDGSYETIPNVAGIPGKEYTLDIILADGSRHSATTFMKPLVEMDSINYSYESEFNHATASFEFYYKILMYANEPEPAGDYYLWNLYINDTLYTDTLDTKTFQSDELINGNYTYGADLFWLDDEVIKEDGTIVKMSIESISKEQHDFIVAVLLETVFKGSPFDGPPANVPSNISNNALGFFYANPVSYREVRVLKGRNP